MGQRTSIQQPSSEIARRPRANSGTAGESTHQSSHHHHRSSNVNNSMRYRFQQRDSTSLSSSNSSSSVDEDNRSDEGATGAELAAAIMNHLGLSSGGVREASTISPSSAPSGSTHRNNHGGGRRSESGVNLNNVNTNTPSSLFHHNRGSTAHNHHRIGGSQRLRGPRSSGFGSGSNTTANELLASGRLNALLQSLEASSSSSSSSHASNALRSMGTQQQQIVINRLRHSLPLLQLLGRDVKCPVCHKMIASDDVEMHLVMCLTRPVLSYNDDVLTTDKGECAICLDEMNAGDQIARLPCLCIYHKDCIDEWFKRRNTCPEHPPVEEDD